MGEEALVTSSITLQFFLTTGQNAQHVRSSWVDPSMKLSCPFRKLRFPFKQLRFEGMKLNFPGMELYVALLEAELSMHVARLLSHVVHFGTKRSFSRR